MSTDFIRRKKETFFLRIHMDTHNARIFTSMNMYEYLRTLSYQIFESDKLTTCASHRREIIIKRKKVSTHM
jgi:hypothetical protein